MKRIESLTFIRFIAALIVVVFHFGKNTGLANAARPFITAGPQMVSLFFVLSGFVMTVAHFNKANENLRDYYVTRIARIVPIYMLALLLSIYLSYGKGNNNATALLLNLAFLQSWFPPYPLTINPPGWSLSVEAFFYLTFPFILFAIKKSNISWRNLLVLSILFYGFTQALLSNLMHIGFVKEFPSPTHDLIYYFPLSHFCSFILGIAGGFIYSQKPEWFNRTGFLPFTILIAAIFINWGALQYPAILRRLAGFPLAFSSSFYSLLFLSLILSLAYSRSIITRIMSMPFLVLLGESSYSLYILQHPMYTLYTKYISTLLKTGADAKFYFFVFLLVIVSIISFLFLEKPAKKLILNMNRAIRKKQDPQLEAVF